MAWCLERYFGHSPEAATDAIERYYKAWKGIHDDDLDQHEGPYWMALRVHFIQDLKGSPGEFPLRRVENGYRDVPWESTEFRHQHCFEVELESNYDTTSLAPRLTNLRG